MNSYSNGEGPATAFVTINAQRIGLNGMLYLVDTGGPSFGAVPLLPYRPNLTQMNITTNTISRTYFMADALHPTSGIDDVRFNPAKGKAYITDAETPSGLVVLDLASGETVRVMDGHPFTEEYMPVSVKGTIERATRSPKYIIARMNSRFCLMVATFTSSSVLAE